MPQPNSPDPVCPGRHQLRRASGGCSQYSLLSLLEAFGELISLSNPWTRKGHRQVLRTAEVPQDPLTSSDADN